MKNFHTSVIFLHQSKSLYYVLLGSISSSTQLGCRGRRTEGKGPGAIPCQKKSDYIIKILPKTNFQKLYKEHAPNSKLLPRPLRIGNIYVLYCYIGDLDKKIRLTFFNLGILDLGLNIFGKYLKLL